MTRDIQGRLDMERGGRVFRGSISKDVTSMWLVASLLPKCPTTCEESRKTWERHEMLKDWRKRSADMRNISIDVRYRTGWEECRKTGERHDLLPRYRQAWEQNERHEKDMRCRKTWANDRQTWERSRQTWDIERHGKNIERPEKDITCCRDIEGHEKNIARHEKDMRSRKTGERQDLLPRYRRTWEEYRKTWEGYEISKDARQSSTDMRKIKTWDKDRISQDMRKTCDKDRHRSCRYLERLDFLTRYSHSRNHHDSLLK